MQTAKDATLTSNLLKFSMTDNRKGQRTDGGQTYSMDSRLDKQVEDIFKEDTDAFGRTRRTKSRIFRKKLSKTNKYLQTYLHQEIRTLEGRYHHQQREPRIY